MNPRPSRLLIVDDNEMNRDMLARRLSRKGYVIGLAESARELLPRVKEDGIDLVLLDIEMPEVYRPRCSSRVAQMLFAH